jgi:transcriptional regulator with XRE-family HTH domain
VSNDLTQRLMERVKRLRESLGLTQEAFAERAGLKYKHYQAVEAGRKANIQFATLIKLAEACGVEAWQLLKFDDDVDSFQPLVSEPKAITRTSKMAKTPKPRRRSS